MRVAVSGATGFVGRHVLSALSAVQDVQVVAIVRNAQAAAIEGVDSVACDIAAPPEDLFDRLGRPDVLIHLAWGGLPRYRELRHFEREAPLSYNFVANLVKTGLRAVVATGTCFEYGMRDGALSEDMPTEPHLPYGFGKDACRRQLEFLRQQHPFAFTWGRLFYMWGDGQSASIYGQLAAAVERGDEVFPMSPGAQLRDYLHVSEVATTLVRLALARADVGVVNICSGQPVSIRQMAERWRDANGWSINFDLGRYAYPDYEPMAFWGDAAKLRSITDPHGYKQPD